MENLLEEKKKVEWLRGHLNAVINLPYLEDVSPNLASTIVHEVESLNKKSSAIDKKIISIANESKL